MSAVKNLGLIDNYFRIQSLILVAIRLQWPACQFSAYAWCAWLLVLGFFLRRNVAFSMFDG